MGDRVIIGIGANLGNCQATVAAVRQRLLASRWGTHWRWSRVFSTPPVNVVSVDGTAPARFLNAVAAVESTMPPLVWLRQLQQVEREFGRQPHEDKSGPWRPRTLDLDLLAVGSTVMDDALNGLILPHPRLHQRWFTLRPMCEVAADWVHPTLGKTPPQLLAELVALASRLPTVEAAERFGIGHEVENPYSV